MSVLGLSELDLVLIGVDEWMGAAPRSSEISQDDNGKRMYEPSNVEDGEAALV